MSDQQRLFHYERIMDEQAKKIDEAAAFLEVIADRCRLAQDRADCRAMAKKLRGDI